MVPDIEIFKSLVDAGASLELSERNLLEIAVSQQKYQYVRVLKSYGLDVNLQVEDKRKNGTFKSLLETAMAKPRNLQTQQALIDQGA